MCDYGGSVTSVLVSMLLLSTVMLQFNICVIAVVLCLNDFNPSCLLTLLLYFTTKNSVIKVFSNLVWLSFYMKAETDSGLSQAVRGASKTMLMYLNSTT